MTGPRVVICTPVYPPKKGGSATYFSTLVKILGSKADITVVTTETGGAIEEETIDGVRILRKIPDRFSSSPPRRYASVLPATFRVLGKLLRDGRYVLHIHSNGIYGYSASLFSSLHSIPLIKEVQDTSDSGFVIRAGNVRRWIATGSFVESRLRDMGIPADRIIRFPSLNPPDLKDIVNRKKGQRTDREDVFRILFVGWLANRVKGVDVLIKGFLKASAERKGLELVIIGDGPDRKELEKLSGGAPVKFLGEMEYQEVVGWMTQSDVLALTSHEEANPRVILEAYETGIPVMATDVGGVSEEVKDGVTGMLVRDGDVEGISGAILKLAGDPDLGRRMGARGAEFLGTLPRWEELADTIYHLYIEYYDH